MTFIFYNVIQPFYVYGTVLSKIQLEVRHLSTEKINYISDKSHQNIKRFY